MKTGSRPTPSASTSTAAGGTRPSFRLQELTFIQPIDKASAKLMDACCNDTDLSDVEIDLVEEGNL